LWSNAHSTVVICDDHSTLSLVTVSGPSWVIPHEKVKREFPKLAGKVARDQRHDQAAAPDPTYWFLQEISDIVQQREPLSANSLDPARPTCSISAGGEGRHDKKVAYFATNTLPGYDQSLQHEREKAGRLADPSGGRHRNWHESIQNALDSRQRHLRRVYDSNTNIRPIRLHEPSDQI
jgi:hypothetical protein